MKTVIIFICCLLGPFALAAQDSAFRIKTAPLTGNVYVHISYGEFGGKVYAANGLYIVTKNGIILIDTPWSEDQTRQLADTLEKRYHKKITSCIVTHFHDDKTAGLDVLKSLGVKTYSTRYTRELCKENDNKQAQFIFRQDTTFHINGITLQTYYPGEGHSKDNIVIWLPQTKVLYGGCFIKSMDAATLGNTADGNVAAWPASAERLMKQFPYPAYVIPGHDGWQGGMQQVTHTLQLLQQSTQH